MTLTEAQRQQFAALAKPLIQWLNENTDPHHTIIVTPASAEVLGGVATIRTEEFLRDWCRWSAGHFEGAATVAYESGYNDHLTGAPHRRDYSKTTGGHHLKLMNGSRNDAQNNGAVYVAVVDGGRSGVGVLYGLAAVLASPPCTVCGTLEARHGIFPTCASHPYTPDANCRHVIGGKCFGAECKNGCALADVNATHGATR